MRSCGHRATASVTQESKGGVTMVSYTPERGFIGSDSFALRYPPKNARLQYPGRRGALTRSGPGSGGDENALVAQQAIADLLLG